MGNFSMLQKNMSKQAKFEDYQEDDGKLKLEKMVARNFLPTVKCSL